MKTFSYEEIGNVTATFFSEDELKEGGLAELNGSQTVCECTEGHKFCGVTRTCRDGVVAVQLRGFVKVPYSGPLPLGYGDVVADGKGGIKDGNGNGVSVMVISTDYDERTAVIWL